MSKKKAQAIFCKCGSIVAGCMEPYCYQDKEWQKDLRDYSKKGYEIKMVDPEEVRVQLSECKCESEQMALSM